MNQSSIETLNRHYSWPGQYTFKFIVPKNKLDEVKRLLDERFAPILCRPSSKGNYISVTLTGMMDSAIDVLAVYQKARQIEGIISI